MFIIISFIIDESMNYPNLLSNIFEDDFSKALFESTFPLISMIFGMLSTSYYAKAKGHFHGLYSIFGTLTGLLGPIGLLLVMFWPDKNKSYYQKIREEHIEEFKRKLM